MKNKKQKSRKAKEIARLKSKNEAIEHGTYTGFVKEERILSKKEIEKVNTSGSIPMSSIAIGNWMTER